MSAALLTDPHLQAPILNEGEAVSAGNRLAGGVFALDARSDASRRKSGTDKHRAYSFASIGRGHRPAHLRAIVGKIETRGADSHSIQFTDMESAFRVRQTAHQPGNVVGPTHRCRVERHRPGKRVVSPFEQERGVCQRHATKYDGRRSFCFLRLHSRESIRIERFAQLDCYHSSSSKPKRRLPPDRGMGNEVQARAMGRAA